MRIPNPTYIPSNATSISFAIAKVIIFIADRKIIVPARPINEAAMPAAVLSALFLGMGYAGSLEVRLPPATACTATRQLDPTRQETEDALREPKLQAGDDRRLDSANIMPLQIGPNTSSGILPPV